MVSRVSNISRVKFCLATVSGCALSVGSRDMGAMLSAVLSVDPYCGLVSATVMRQAARLITANQSHTKRFIVPRARIMRNCNRATTLGFGPKGGYPTAKLQRLADRG